MSAILTNPRLEVIEDPPTLDWSTFHATEHVRLVLDGKTLCYAFDWIEIMNHHQALCHWLREDEMP